MDVDWQNNRTAVKDRGEYLLQTKKWSDCSFLVGTAPNDRIIAGHKLLLAMGSPVFERMFFGQLREETDPIVITDVQPEAFEDMMRYIYTDYITIGSFDKLCELYYVAKKYMLPHVVAQCSIFLKLYLSPENACRAYEFAKLFDEPDIMRRSMDEIATNTREVLSDPSFMDIELSTLVAILDQNHLDIDSELELFDCLLRFASETGILDESGQPEGDKDSLLRQALKKIRFLTMTPEQFAKGPARSKLLQPHEALAILIEICSPTLNDSNMPEGFCTLRSNRSLEFTLPIFLSSE